MASRSLLDLGCGSGGLAAHMHGGGGGSWPAEYVGYDIVPALISRAVAGSASHSGFPGSYECRDLLLQPPGPPPSWKGHGEGGEGQGRAAAGPRRRGGHWLQRGRGAGSDRRQFFFLGGGAWAARLSAAGVVVLACTLQGGSSTLCWPRGSLRSAAGRSSSRRWLDGPAGANTAMCTLHPPTPLIPQPLPPTVFGVSMRERGSGDASRLTRSCRLSCLRRTHPPPALSRPLPAGPLITKHHPAHRVSRWRLRWPTPTTPSCSTFSARRTTRGPRGHGAPVRRAPPCAPPSQLERATVLRPPSQLDRTGGYSRRWHSCAAGGPCVCGELRSDHADLRWAP